MGEFTTRDEAIPRYKVWYIPQVPMKAFEVETTDPKVAHLILDILGLFSFFEYENNIKPDYADAGGVVVMNDDGEWEDLEEEEA